MPDALQPDTHLREAPTTADLPESPASSSELRSAYLDQAVIGYLLYGVGAVTAFLAVALSLSDASAALHSSMLAVGFLAAGLIGDRLDAVIGVGGSQVAAYGLLAAASVCIVTAPAFVVTLAGAGMAGLGVGLLLAHANRTFTRGGGARARVQIGRAALVAMVASLSVPVAIGLGENSGLGWQLAFVIGGLLIAVGLWASRFGRAAAPGLDLSPRPGRLPGGYWLAWCLVVLVVSVEFSFVFWAATLVERGVGISLADATLVATGFYAGMTTMRIGLSFHLVAGRDPLMLIMGSLVVALVGSLLAWAAGSVALAGLGIYLGGFGVGALYPMTVSIALALVPGRQDRASTRLLLASGVAILVAPFLLGLAADLSDVSTAWLLIPGLCLAALVLCVPLRSSRAQ